MKANELMLGDWVYGLYPDGSRYANPFRISAVDTYPSNKSPRIVTGGGYGFQEEHLAPITITQKILEKNGFKKYGDTGWWLEDDYYDVQMYEWSDSIWVARYESNEMDCPHEQLTMSYIHELQHFLKAVGIEKEIEL